MSKELLFSVTKSDLKFDYFRSSGAGGQHRNKTDTACRCKHKPSGAVGEGKEHKSQKQNKQAAFKRMVASSKFKKWLRLETAKKLGILDRIKEEVEYEMSHNVKVEGKDDKGRWVDEKESQNKS